MNIDKMSKDELKAYADENGIEIDMRKKLSDLIDEVKKHSVEIIDEEEEVKASPQSKFILNTKTGLVFEITPHLAIHKRFNDELVYCDKNGNRL